jgi:hypothetical protein
MVDSRLADGGQTLAVEPPDQGLCAGNGFVLESVNSAIRVYDTNGNALSGVTSLHTFYGYPFANSAAGLGPQISDPFCYYDPDTRRWFHVIATADRVGTTSALAGTNHIDLAVSQTSSPLGLWNIYKIPTQNDGTEGTPDHHCDGGPCFGDFPKIGADANGIYITENESPFFFVGAYRAQIYALSKRALAAGVVPVTVVQFDTSAPTCCWTETRASLSGPLLLQPRLMPRTWEGRSTSLVRRTQRLLVNPGLVNLSKLCLPAITVFAFGHCPTRSR